MKTGTHVKIKNNTVKDYRFFTSNRTGIITHISSSKLYTVKMDFNTELAIQTTAENLIVIPNNVFTEWFAHNSSQIIILSRHTKPYVYLVLTDDILSRMSTDRLKFIGQITKFHHAECRNHDKSDIISIYKVDNRNNNAIETIADILSEYDILLLSGNQYSLGDLT